MNTDRGLVWLLAVLVAVVFLVPLVTGAIAGSAGMGMMAGGGGMMMGPGMGQGMMGPGMPGPGQMPGGTGPMPGQGQMPRGPNSMPGAMPGGMTAATGALIGLGAAVAQLGSLAFWGAVLVAAALLARRVLRTTEATP